MIRRQRGIIHTNAEHRQIREFAEEGNPKFDMVANECFLGYVPPHTHPEMEIYLQISGRSLVNINGEIIQLSAGEGCFINTDIIHEMRPAAVPEECLYRSFVFDRSIVGGAPDSVFERDYIRPLTETGTRYCCFSNNDIFVSAFEKVFDACDKEPRAWQFTVREGLSLILLMIPVPETNGRSARSEGIHADRVRRMMEYVEENFRTAVTLKSVADAATVCPRECQRLFREILHQSPMGYLNGRRLREAENELIATDKPVSEIALRCGFSAISYFTEQFRRKNEITPTEFRKLYRSENQ